MFRLMEVGADSQRERWLPGLASGEKRGTLAVWDEQSGWAPDHSELEPGGDGKLTGTKIAVTQHLPAWLHAAASGIG